MATTTTKRTTSAARKLQDVMVESEPVKLDMTKAKSAPPAIGDYALINVRSNVWGQLYYVDPMTKEEYTWLCCGETQQLPMQALRHMKAGAAKFFERQLVVITGFGDENAEKYTVEDIYRALFITQHYTNYLDPTDVESICSWETDEIPEKVGMLTRDAKTKLIIALNTFIEKGVLDSVRKIRAFEQALGCELLVDEH